MSTKYRLLKDLPDAKIGDTYIFYEPYGRYCNEKNPPKIESFDESTIKNSVGWFEKIEETPTINKAFSAALVETALNILKVNGYEKLYTIEDMRKCFNEARRYKVKTSWPYNEYPNIYPTFDDYLKSIKQ